jgi:GNAT superfamily N-acetyltransferase
MNTEICRVNPDEVEEILDLQHRVLGTDRPIGETRFHFNGENPQHVGMFIAEPSGGETKKLIGCASFVLCPVNLGFGWQHYGLVIEEDYRQQGLGRRLMMRAEQIVETGSSVIHLFLCNVPIEVASFYLKVNWNFKSPIRTSENMGRYREMYWGCEP